MKKHSLTRQITSIVSILVAGAILLCWVLNTTLLPRYYMHNKKHVLMENYETISNASEQDKLESDEFTVTFDNLCSNGNIMTLILQPDGKVLRSSVNDLDALRGELWNVLLHTDDMEVLYSNDQYQLLRKNDTRLDSEYLVLVGVLENGDMILMRTAVESIRESAAISNRFLLFVGAAAIVSSLLVAFFTTRHITKPLQQLTDISKRMVDLDFNAKYESNRSNSYEVEELGNHINRLSENLERTISELKTANVELQDDIEKKIQIDEMRKEFLSNVSHELKTPLQSIIGSAELMENNLVKEEDMPRFVGHIRKEAERLVNLVEDIIRLSWLDENRDMETELVSLKDIAAETKEALENTANEKNVTINISGEDIKLHGVRSLLYEIVYNLCENGIKYNKEGGKVDITLSKEAGKDILVVEDTGIGIKEDQQSRIFERFYRVDKSRSKETGGTGLGLSIVKHAAMYHNADVTLESTEGQGSKFTVMFPREE